MSTFAWAVVVAAGRGARFGGGVNKVYAALAGRPVLAYSLDNIAMSGVFDGIVVVHAPGEDALARMAVSDAKLPVLLVEGGERRQDSVARGLDVLPPETRIVAVHDGARPLAPPELFARCVAVARECGSGVAASPVRDTVKRVCGEETVLDTPDRNMLRAAKTPQCFRLGLLRAAYDEAREMRWDVTDDAQAVELSGNAVRLVPCGEDNIKITRAEDIRVAEAYMGITEMPRVGMGYDAHRLVQGRNLVLCGVRIPHEKGLEGHSDADVAAHAVSDALLGAAGVGDIGMLFPDTDASYKDADSMAMLENVVSCLRERGFKPSNIDVTIIAQRPKLSPYREAMAQGVARAAGLDVSCVCVKMTTTEHMGFTGREEGIAAQAVAVIARV